MKKIAQQKKSVTKQTKAAESGRRLKAAEPTEQPPFVAATPTRVKLEPLTGPIGPRATRLARIDLDRNDAGKFVPSRPIEQISAERVILSSKDDSRHNVLNASFAALIGQALGVDVNPSAETFEYEVLAHVQQELHTIEHAVRHLSEELSDPEAVALTIYRLRNRIEAAQEMARRTRAEPTKTEAFNYTEPPPPHEVAGALLTLPGVLTGAPDAWERLVRIAERLDVAVLTQGSKYIETMLEFAKDTGHKSHDHYGQSEGKPYIALFPSTGDEEEEALARMLGHAVAKREGYGEVTDAWRKDLAASLLQRPLSKEAQ